MAIFTQIHLFLLWTSESNRIILTKRFTRAFKWYAFQNEQTIKSWLSTALKPDSERGSYPIHGKDKATKWAKTKAKLNATPWLKRKEDMTIHRKAANDTIESSGCPSWWHHHISLPGDGSFSWRKGGWRTGTEFKKAPLHHGTRAIGTKTRSRHDILLSGGTVGLPV
jgi:hypothetical protein